MNAIIVGALMYSFATTAPLGWKEVPVSVCKRAYGINADGYLIDKQGSKRFVRPFCYVYAVSSEELTP